MGGSACGAVADGQLGDDGYLDRCFTHLGAVPFILPLKVLPPGIGEGRENCTGGAIAYHPLKHESIPREFCAWLLAATLGLVAATAVGFAMLLPYGTHSGSPDRWAVKPPWYVRGLLLGVLGTIVLGKGLVLASLYVWLQEWWLPWERLFFTLASVGLVPWVLLLSRWNLVLFRY